MLGARAARRRTGLIGDVEEGREGPSRRTGQGEIAPNASEDAHELLTQGKISGVIAVVHDTDDNSA